MNPYIRRAIVGIGVAAVVILLLGATYQGVATALERRDFPAPGHLSDLGGHQLHIRCEGEGPLTVIVEAPEAGISAMWGLVQPALAESARVCSYDRAGLGWSEAGDGPFDPRTVPIELHAVLAREKVLSPYLMIGQSLGAAFALLYMAQYPEEVIGLVLLDDPSAGARSTPSPDAVRAFGRHLGYAPWLARTGALRAGRLLSNRTGALPDQAAGAVGAFLTRPDHLTRAGREFASWNDTIALATAVRLPAHLPTTRIESSRPSLGSYVDSRSGADAVVRAAAGIIASVQTR